MDKVPDTAQSLDGVLDVLRPLNRTAPVVFSSPHSGRFYPQAFIDASRLDALTIRRSEDAFVDDLFGAAPNFGAPMLRAHFPRAYVDPNREELELDPTMFAEDLPREANVASPRISAGLGTIAKVVTSGEEIYRGKLELSEVRARIERHYRPYHDTLKHLIDETVQQFGACLLIDCHSMPSIGGPMDRDSGAPRVDMVLGDCHGASAERAVSDYIDKTLTGMGYNVKRNDPYAGGYTTQHYGDPAHGVQAVQIEVNRALYMDEHRMERTEGFGPLQANLTKLIEALALIAPEFLGPAR